MNETSINLLGSSYQNAKFEASELREHVERTEETLAGYKEQLKGTEKEVADLKEGLEEVGGEPDAF